MPGNTPDSVGKPATKPDSDGVAETTAGDSYRDPVTIAARNVGVGALDDALRDIDRKVFAERFDFIKELGSGGMGRVLKAIDRKVHREVAIKRLKQARRWDHDLLARFLREARLAACLNHPCIMTVYDILFDDEGPYIVLELIEGGSLAARLAHGAMPWKEAVDLLLPICEAVSAAHARGIIHRDIKPLNILLTKSGVPKLGGFGFARCLEGQGETLTGEVLGTLDYMAPEQLSSSKTADARADLYSLAAMLFHMVTGETPGPSSVDALPVELRVVILQALQRKPEKRPDSVAEFAQRLTEIRRTGASSGPVTLIQPVVNVAVPPLQNLAEQIALSTANAARWRQQAQQALDRCEYAVAVELLERIPQKLRPQLLWREAVAKRDRLTELEVTISQLVNDGDYANLSLPVQQALELVPGRVDLVALQQAIVRRPGIMAGELIHIILHGLEVSFRWCPPGKFKMGSPENEKDRGSNENQVSVELTRGFWLGETVVTQALFESVLHDNPSHFKGAQHPVENVSWDEAQNFCETLTDQLRDARVLDYHGRISLPTEAQWEYACRAGTTTAYSFGNDAARLEQYAWFDENTGGETHPVGMLEANPWGLRDMHGNVWEWCADWYDEQLSGGTNPVGPIKGSYRVNRGGCWRRSAGFCRSACRLGYGPSSRDNLMGFRVCLSSDWAKLTDFTGQENAAGNVGPVGGAAAPTDCV